MSSDYIQSLLNKRYSGKTRSIVIGIDVGTTFSGVSYALLYPEKVPKLRPVTRFSGGDASNTSNSKIPSIIYYDKDGVPKAIGQTTTLPKVRHEAIKGKWFKVEYFKMHLRPSGRKLKTNGLKLGELPPGKSAEQVMGDFLRYLVQEAGEYISSAHGADTWKQVKDKAIFILGHPNGWTGYCQQRYRTSAVLGGLIPDTDEGHKQITFVTEGEAIALACLSSGLGPDSDTFKPGFRFIIVDAGGGTVDLTTLEVVGTSPLKLKECTAPDCRFVGSVLVNTRAKDLLKKRLAKSEYDNEERIDSLISKFEDTTKRTFNGEDDFLEIGLRDEYDEELGISGGCLTLSCEELAGCFRPSVNQTIESILGQYSASHNKEGTMPVWLVGGLGKSEYLLKELRRRLEGKGISIQTPDWASVFGSNAVAKGAVLHYLEHPVTARICRRTYGTPCLTLFHPSMLADYSIREIVEHSEIFPMIGPVFAPIIKKGTLIDEGESFFRSFWKPSFDGEAPPVHGDLLCYDGDLPIPLWYEDNKDKFKTIGHLEANIPPSAVQDETDSDIECIEFDVELKFGKTEVEARIRWEEKGEMEYAPAKIRWLEE